MMTQAFYTGVSGVQTSGIAIDVLSDNIANISTVGYRGYSVEFASLFEESITMQSGNSTIDSTIGVGARVQSSSMDEEYGTLALTGNSTDLALYGDGWFGIQGEEDKLYTRAGNFTFDENNDLVTNDGLHVLGTLANNIDENDNLIFNQDETKLGTVADQDELRFPKSLNYPAQATTEVKFHANLGLADEIKSMGVGAVDPTGIKNNLKLEFTKSKVQTPPGIQWDILATTQTLNGNTIYDTQTGTVNFNEKGGLVSTTLTTIDNNGSITNIDLGTGFSGIVSINSQASASSSSANGTVAGDLLGYAINKNAEIIATFTNGMQSSVGKVAVYHFVNDQGLLREAGSRFKESANSGEPLFFKDEDGNNILGTDITNFQLESSNVKLEVALTELIILQRTFDSNSRSITTADEMMQKALNMDA